MSLAKAIQHHKEYRKPYYGSKAIDHSCRNGGSCPWCKQSRLYCRADYASRYDYYEYTGKKLKP